MYTKQMVDNWWTLLLRGALIALLGVVVIIKPIQSALTLVLIFGAFGILNAVISLISLIAGIRRRLLGVIDILFGLISLAAGLFILRNPQITLFLILQLFSFLVFLSALLDLLGAWQIRKRLQGEWRLMLAGILKLLFALVMVLIPQSSLTAVLWIIGAVAIVLGAFEAYNAFRIRSLKKVLTF